MSKRRSPLMIWKQQEVSPREPWPHCPEGPGEPDPSGCGPHLIPAQGCEDESVLPHDAVWELLLPVLILRGPQGECELGELGLAELLGRCLPSLPRWREAFPPLGLKRQRGAQARDTWGR